MMLRKLAMLPFMVPITALAAGGFVPLASDGIHDAEAPASTLLQQPAEALRGLPQRPKGGVDWVQALHGQYIEPRTSVTGGAPMPSVDLDITMRNTGSMPEVLFPHQAHTEWLTCSNCHSGIFLPQQGGNFITMAAIMEGKYCGVCHGTVAFSPLDCTLCHNQAPKRSGLR